MKPTVFITRRIPEEARAILEEACHIRMWEEEDIPVPREILQKESSEVDGIYALLTEEIDDVLLSQAQNLKIVSNMAVGYNNIDVSAATKNGVMVTNTPGVLTETTADLTFALLMSTARRLNEASQFLRNGQWKTWSPMLLTGQDIFASTIGIIGLGRIGEAVARRAKGFNMNILYHNRSRKPQLEEELGVSYASLKDLLSQSDYVCVLTPFTPETKNLIDSKELALMKESAILINTSRGGIVNEDALYKALKNEEIWAAGLDVFEEEPLSADHPFLTLPNVTTLPHIGSASIQTRKKMALLAAHNLLQGLNGEKPDHLVNPDVINKGSHE